MSAPAIAEGRQFSRAVRHTVPAGPLARQPVDGREEDEDVGGVIGDSDAGPEQDWSATDSLGAAIPRRAPRGVATGKAT